MKKGLKGFTLAEVLITLTIIGVVAALTLPSLSTNVARSQIGPGLAKAINTLENTNRTIMGENETTNLSSVCGANYVTGCLREALTGSSAANVEYAGASGFSSGESNVSFQTKDGIAFYQVTAAFNNNSADETSGLYTLNNNPANQYAGKAYIVAIDINGTKNPNTAGQDLFFVYVDNNGTVIPVGGRQAREYLTTEPELDGNGNAIKDKDGKWIPKTDPDWILGNSRACNRTNGIVNGINCAGYVVDNGYRADY